MMAIGLRQASSNRKTAEDLMKASLPLGAVLALNHEHGDSLKSLDLPWQGQQDQLSTREKQ